MIIPRIDEAQNYRHIITQSSAELVALEHEGKEKLSRLQVIAEESATIQSRATARNQQDTTATQDVARLREHFEQAQVSAKLTPISHDTETQLKAQEAHLRQAEKRLATLLQRASKERSQDEARERELQQERAACEQRLQTINRLTVATQNAQDEAREQLATFVHRDYEAQMALQDARVANLEKQLTDARRERAEVISEALRELASWQEHRQQFAERYVVPQDATTDLIEAAVALVTRLLNTADQTTIDTSILRQAGPYVGDLADLLTWLPRDIVACFAGRTSQALTLRTQLEQLQKLLAVYRQAKLP